MTWQHCSASDSPHCELQSFPQVLEELMLVLELVGG